MGYLFMVLGLLCMALTYKEFLNYIREREEAGFTLEKKEDKVKSIEEKLEILNAKVDLIAETVEGISHNIKLEKAKKKAAFKTPENKNFATKIKAQINSQEYEKMFEEYEKGASVTEIAKKFNRGKGEVQLILNLKK